MKKTFFLWIVLIVSAMAHNAAYAQEERESSEVYLEEYTDEFQENFFEALKLHQMYSTRTSPKSNLERGLRTADCGLWT